MSWVIQGKPDGAVPEVGKVYDVRHSRKGAFRIKATAVSGEWLTGVIVSGTAKAIMSYNVKDEGESITVRDSLVYLFEVQQEKTS